MSRRQRLHVAGGTYYVVQHGNMHHPLFSQPDDYVLFERLLATSLRRTNARVHGYCWTPQAIHLILQIDEISVGPYLLPEVKRIIRDIRYSEAKEWADHVMTLGTSTEIRAFMKPIVERLFPDLFGNGGGEE